MRHNWASYGARVTLRPDTPDWQRHLLTDPQTAGGLLVACASERADAIAGMIRGAGYPLARVVGHAESGAPAVRVAG